jgi:hypothetical protein
VSLSAPYFKYVLFIRNPWINKLCSLDLLMPYTITIRNWSRNVYLNIYEKRGFSACPVHLLLLRGNNIENGRCHVCATRSAALVLTLLCLEVCTWAVLNPDSFREMVNAIASCFTLARCATLLSCVEIKIHNWRTIYPSLLSSIELRVHKPCKNPVYPPLKLHI